MSVIPISFHVADVAEGYKWTTHLTDTKNIVQYSQGLRYSTEAGGPKKNKTNKNN